MILAHLTLATPDVERTAEFLEAVFGFPRNPTPANSPVPIVWLNVGNGQELHVIHVPGFEASPYELEFGRHVAFFCRDAELDSVKERVVAHGGVLVEPLRTTPFRRCFFREPVNGYLFEVIGRPEPSAGPRAASAT